MKITFQLDLLDGSLNYESTPSMTARSIFYYIQSAGHFFCNSTYSTLRSDYDSMLLLYTLNGQGILEYRGQTFNITKGQLFLIDCKETQYYASDRKNPWEFVYIHFNGSESRNYVKYILEGSGPVFTLQESSVIPQYIRQIHEMLNKKDVRSEIVGSCLIIEILTELLLYSCHGALEQNSLPETIQKIIDKLERSYFLPLNLDSLAEDICISKFYLSRQFKKYTGFSPYEYLLKCRLNHAKDLLKNSDLPVSEIGMKVGFESASHFIKLFKSQESITPLNFRKHWR